MDTLPDLDATKPVCGRCGRDLMSGEPLIATDEAPPLCQRCTTFLEDVRKASAERGVYFGV